jgi:Fe-S-cluster containining protein
LNSKKLRKLKNIYSTIPKTSCTGECQITCGELAMSKGEFDHLTKVSGEKPHIVNGDRCNYLKEGRCSVYEDRPSCCRLYGVVDEMRCQYCEPEKVLTANKGRAIQDKINVMFGETKRKYVLND